MIMRNLLILLLCLLSLGCSSRDRAIQRSRARSSTQIEEQSSGRRGRAERSRTDNNSRGTSSVVDSPKRGKEMSASEIFEKYAPAVFKIHAVGGYTSSQGSGFFISSDGVAVSNYHVFEGTTKGYEQIILNDGTVCKVEQVYHYSKEEDFIIFKVALSSKVRYIPIAASSPKVGEKVFTIGSPRGLDNTLSSGEVSQLRDNGDVIQINAPVDHGSSGGVLLNAYGEAIGITSAGIDDSPANLNFAINISILKPYIPRL